MQSSGEDEQIQREVWTGAVPVALNLARDEVATPQAPEPFFLMAPRNGYLPLQAMQSTQHFQASAPAHATEMWLEIASHNVPAKWNLPTGVLYDLWGEEGEDLPWAITVHFTNFPAKMLRCTNEETVRAHYMSNLKEANYLKHGDGAKVNTLSVESQTDLWDGLRLEKYDQFWKVHRQLEATVQKIKSVPVRFVRRNLPFIQLPLSAINDQGDLKTLGEALVEVLPKEFHSSTEVAAGTRVLVQGVQPSLETPIAWLAYHCCHPDNFLYVVVRS